MQNVVGIDFQKSGKMEYYSPKGFDLDVGDWVVVESKRGLEMGRVKYAPLDVADQDVTLPLKEIVRLATEDDLLQYEKNEYDADEAMALCKETIQQHELEMRLVNCEYTLDKSKVIFNFTSDERVDFRKLVKVLAQKLKTRIELRQIGVRDEAKLLGGIGPCGRSLCCSTFLGDFEPVSIKMAKDQNLSLNPTKISGLCGRLMCCLQYEDSVYEDAKEKLPDYGDKVMTTEGKGRVVGLNFLADIVKVQLEGHSLPMDYASDELTVLKQR